MTPTLILSVIPKWFVQVPQTRIFVPRASISLSVSKVEDSGSASLTPAFIRATVAGGSSAFAIVPR